MYSPAIKQLQKKATLTEKEKDRIWNDDQLFWEHMYKIDPAFRKAIREVEAGKTRKMTLKQLLKEIDLID
ncbi:MAG TPA: hypothetical protein VGQ00_01885 [Candidatus Norongarragalinales archaeon]|jgi:hypothetical protein|nr:hypothetical protein [Candidatus Norongarragalinales archaeon]